MKLSFRTEAKVTALQMLSNLILKVEQFFDYINLNLWEVQKKIFRAQDKLITNEDPEYKPDTSYEDR